MNGQGTLANLGPGRSHETGFVYFIVEKPRRFVKIGWSVDPCHRLTSLQIGNPRTLKIYGLIRGTPLLEPQWHMRFRHLKARQEWFRVTPELMAAIDAEITHRASPHPRDGRTTREQRIIERQAA